MTARHPSLASARRPSSAIFIGLPLQSSPPSPAHSSSSTHSQLPSPPTTNSGSTGDSSSTSAGSTRRTGMYKGNKHTSLSDDDDNVSDHDEDDTAKLSNERRSGKGEASDYNTSSSTLERVKSLTERNRKVIDKLSSITSPDSHSRSSLTTPSAPSSSSSRTRSPAPPAFSSSSSSTASTSSRVSFAVSPRGGSGSETEREQHSPDRVRPSSRDFRSHSSAANDPSMPLGSAHQHISVFERDEPRQRLRSAPSSPANLPAAPASSTPRKHTSTTFAVIGSGRRSRRVSIQQLDAEDEDPLGQSQMTGGGKKNRAPLPREFRDRRSLDGRSVGESSTSSQHTQDHERTISPGVLIARGAASPQSSGAGGTFSVTPTSPRAQRPPRPSTMRDSSRRVQRWNSVDEAAFSGSGNNPIGDDPDGRRQSRHAGSAESPLGGREGRSVVGEGLRAAGLAPRGSEDVFAEGISQRRTRLSGGLGNRPSQNGTRNADSGELRYGTARVDRWTPEEGRDPRTPPPTSGSLRYGAARNIHSILSGSSSRASTSLGSYGGDEEGPRTAPLRPYRSSYVLPERTTPSHTPQHERSHTSPYGRSTQHAQTPSSEHARLMLDSLAMFEAQLARIPTSSSAPDLSRVANSVVQSANGLNTLLRAGNAHALEAQIEAEVGDAAAQVDASEVWRQIGGEYRESVRVSDELVRTVTALLLGVGRLVREAVKERGTDSPDLGGGGGGSGRSSLDGGERSVKPGRRLTEVDARRGAEESVFRESRRTLEDAEGSVRRTAMTRVELHSRPSTSLSMTLDRDRDLDRGLTEDDDGEETARERQRSSTLDRLSTRRMFTPRAVHTSSASQDSIDFSHPSPSPALRTSVDRDRVSMDCNHNPHRSLPPLAVPPPLPSLPSESVDRRGSTRRRSKFSSTSNATVRGTSIFPAVHSSEPTTAVSAHTVSAAGEMTAFPLTRVETSSGRAVMGLQEQQEKDVRKRSMSITAGGSGEEGTSKSSATRVLRSSRVRMSLDGVAKEEEQHSPPLPPSVNGERRERRRTINDLPS